MILNQKTVERKTKKRLYLLSVNIIINTEMRVGFMSERWGKRQFFSGGLSKNDPATQTLGHRRG